MNGLDKNNLFREPIRFGSATQDVLAACAKEREQANDVNIPRFNVVGYLVIAVFAVAIVLVVDLVRRLI